MRVLPDRIAGYASTPGMVAGSAGAGLPEGGVDFEKKLRIQNGDILWQHWKRRVEYGRALLNY